MINTATTATMTCPDTYTSTVRRRSLAAKLRRLLPGSRGRQVQEAFKLGLHTGLHMSAGDVCTYPECPTWDDIRERGAA